MRERLVDAAGVERQLADQLAPWVDHTDVLIGDQELDRTSLVGPPEADFVEAAAVAQADPCRSCRRTTQLGLASLDDGPYGDALPEGTILGMALKPLSAKELAETPTLFANFMGRMDTSYKTLGQLRAIYRERSKALHAADDQADDLRVDRFIDDMESDMWNAASHISRA
jgi:hypothetical protein